jgi:hypothetical protein
MGRCTAGAVVAATPGAARARRAATAVQPPTAGEGAGEAGGATYEETIRARSARKQVGEGLGREIAISHAIVVRAWLGAG